LEILIVSLKLSIAHAMSGTKNNDRVWEWGIIGHATKLETPLHKPHFPAESILVPPAHLGASWHEADNGCPLLSALIGFLHPASHGLAIGRITPADPLPWLGKAIIVFSIKLETFRIGWGGAHIKGKTKLCMEAVEEVLWGFSLNSLRAVIDFAAGLLRSAVASLKFSPLRPDVLVYTPLNHAYSSEKTCQRMTFFGHPLASKFSVCLYRSTVTNTWTTRKSAS
jgi:hypothetical protein